MEPQANATAENGETSDNLSIEELVQTTLNEPQDKPEEETEEEETETEEVEETEEEETEDDEEEEEPEEQSDELDLTNLSDEQLDELAKRIPKSRTQKRIGKLVAQFKAAQARISVLESEEVRTSPNPSNPFSHLMTRKEIADKRTELERVIDATDEILDENEDLLATDIIEYQGKTFAKKEIRAANRNSRRALDKLLPAQLAEVESLENIKNARAETLKQVDEKFPEFADEDSSVAKGYRSMMENENVLALEKTNPKLWAEMPGILALAAIGLDLKVGNRAKLKNAVSAGTRPRPKVSGAPSSGVAGSSKRGPKNKNVAKQRFEESGSVDDLVNMLMEQ